MTFESTSIGFTLNAEEGLTVGNKMKAEEGILYVQVSIPVGRGWQKAEVIYTANNTIELAVEILNRLYRKESYISVRGKSVSSS